MNKMGEPNEDYLNNDNTETTRYALVAMLLVFISSNLLALTAIIFFILSFFIGHRV